MLDMTQWLSAWSAAVLGEFGEERVRFLGLQGSRARGEAREDSDIDAVVILDVLTAGDMACYAACTSALPERGRLCGFIAGEEELRRWESSELFQFYHDTRPLRGSLDFLLPRLDRRAALGSARTGAGAVYHGCAHYLLNGGGEAALDGLRKGAFFTLRALRYLETGEFPPSRSALPDADRRLLSAGAEELFGWASETLRALGGE